MLDQQASRTALATAFARAVHVYLDPPPPVLDDRLSIRLLPASLRRAVLGQKLLVPEWLRRGGRGDTFFGPMRAQIVVRARYAEDCLAEARRDGVTRYVVLGAGLDTYALRQPNPAVDVLEIDHPASQRWKRRLLTHRSIELPPTLSFLPVDFERSALADVWVENDAPDFVSWLGTTYYLSAEALRGTLVTLAERTQPGSQLVLDYWRRGPGIRDLPLLWGTQMAVALQGEPMRSFFEPDQIAALAEQTGWRVLEDLSAAEQRSRYLSQRRDGLAVPAFAHLLRLGR